jgi:Icc-related predicted phosphoesterase
LTSIVYTADLHGDLDFYRAAGRAAIERRADALILGGDLCPGTPSASALRLPVDQPEFLLNQLSPLLDEWKQSRPALRVFAIPGNDDCQTVLPVLEELELNGLIENLHQEVRTLGAYNLLGLSFVPPTPFALKDFERRDSAQDSRQESESYRCVFGTPGGFRVIEDFSMYLDSLPTIEEELRRLPVRVPARTIAVVHSPPINTHCDVLFDGTHVGSRALRHWIEQEQPLLTLHGHIHESPKMSGSFVDRIGQTVVVNPGCNHSKPHVVLLNLEKLTEIEHTVFGKAQIS